MDEQKSYKNSFHITTLNESNIKVVKMRGIEISLIGDGDGTQVIHEKMEAGKKWAIVPDGEGYLEFFMLLSGEMELKVQENIQTIYPGFSITNVNQEHSYIFTSLTDVEFLYISSRPVFQHYAHTSSEMEKMAISIEEKDGYTAHHCDNIKNMAIFLGEKLGLNSSELLILSYGSFFHDIGKVKIPLEILNKPGRLTEEEFNIMKKHTIYGSQILKGLNYPFIDKAALIVEQHHERWDGTGYPHGLKGSEISLGASIVSVVDSYDAMTSDRVYQKRRTQDEAVEEIKKYRGKYYNPDVVDIFLKHINEIEKLRK
jgi:HD-GYP domain-containing protein (c-di-GMP phosphodiesterase class II)